MLILVLIHICYDDFFFNEINFFITFFYFHFHCDLDEYMNSHGRERMVITKTSFNSNTTPNHIIFSIIVIHNFSLNDFA